MKKYLITFLLLILPNIVFANTYIEKTISGYKIRVIEYNAKSNLYDLQFLKSSTGTQESLDKILSDNNAISGVNGIFFCPDDYSFCAGKQGTTNNERYFKGIKYPGYENYGDRPMFVIDKNKNSFIYKADEINIEKETQIYDGLSNRPLILKDGQNQLESYREQGLIDGKMSSYSTKNFICNTKDNSKIFFGLVYSINIDSMPGLLQELGCNDALNLDAGLSTAFIYNGKYIVGPQRNVIDAIGIVPKFDVTELNSKANLVSELLYKRALTKAKLPENQVKILESYTKQLENLKQKVYTNFSQDIIENNPLVGELEKTGYKLEVTNEKSLKIVYLLNKINFLLKEKIGEMKKVLNEKIINIDN